MSTIIAWRATVVAVCALGLLAGVAASAALARHNFSMLEDIEPREVEAGQSVTVAGFSYTDTAEIRFGALDGPLLTRLEPNANDDIEGEVQIPADASPGRYVIYAVQRDGEGDISRYPGQADVWVVDDGGRPLDADRVPVEPRATGLIVDDDAGLTSLLVVALGTVAVAGALGVAATSVLSRSGRADDGGETTS